ncbi:MULTISPECIES: ribosome small subunit-dependent GTPase A [unclassified Methanoculleus]|jgi:ribosome biogenesis GTPase|uniref:Ribosome small subunit-dependent GTPase A n=1 Tax=Methanoculleus palmolei TaxID=72612 RepID=A0ABD8A7Z5_9EURY|nr:ribosome small subunit-dependent GTPase A [Methanoculleus sp. UBA377]MDD2473396.1 ribosome small subunit-dependent GTPase A [Methanoculleus sp.]WOX55654.1 ribosome small subunit-dependent GTPase A [Methanoculleus palmolei]
MSQSTSRCKEQHPCTLEDLGWTKEHDAAFSKYAGPYLAGRVACRQKTVWDVLVDGGSVTAGVSGALRKIGRFPAVGDFVVLLNQPEAGTSMIVDILPQKTRFARGTPGREGADQVIAANIDTVFIVTAAGRDLNARRIERFLAITHASGACPVVVINKSDLADDPVALADEITSISPGIPVIPISAVSGEGVDRLDPYLSPRTTIALIGSSGVGKSTLINRLVGRPVQATSHTRDYDDRGRHTTTVRQLFVLAGGALMIDNPGLREVGIGTASAGIADTFPDILELAEGCRFSDCRHEEEPGCAVQAAVADGTLSASRLNSFHRLMRELAFERDKEEIGLVRLEKKRWKEIGKIARDFAKTKGR